MGGRRRYRSEAGRTERRRRMTLRGRLAVITTALSVLTSLILVSEAAGAAAHGPTATARQLVGGGVVGSLQVINLTSDNLGIAMWSVPDGTTLISVSREVDGSKVSDLAFTNGSTSSDLPGLRLPGEVRDVTFGPDSTAYLTVATPDDQTAGWLLRLGRADSSATVLHTWLVDPAGRYRAPYSLEYANGRLFVEALSANTIFSCLPQLEAFDLAGASVGTSEATSCGGRWQADDGLVFASDLESYSGLFVDSATGESHRVGFPSSGPIWNIAHGPGGRIAVVTGNGHNRCETGYVSVIGPSGVLLSRPLHVVLEVASDAQCLVRALTLLDNGSAVVGADLPGIGAALFVVAPDGSSNQIWTSAPETIRSLHAAAGNAFVMVSTSADGCGLPHLEDCGRVHLSAGTVAGVRPLDSFGGAYGDSRTAPFELVSIGHGQVVVVSQRNQCFCSDPDTEDVLDRVDAPGIERQRWHDPAGESPPPPSPSTFKYVALGDSYSAGEGLEPYFDLTNRCHRSRLAYAVKVEAPGRVGVSIYELSGRADSGYEWGFQACSGAVTASMIEEGHHGDPLPQLEPDRSADVNNPLSLPVDGETDLVTLTIGGNDVEFAKILSFCFTRVDCRTARYTETETLTQAVDRLFEDLPAKLDAVFTRLRSQAKTARVLVLGYPHLLPRSSNEQNCRALSQKPLGSTNVTVGLSRKEQEFIRTQTDRLNALLKARSEAAGLEFVRVDALFADHEVCGSKGEWINGPSYTLGKGVGSWPARKIDDETFHPKDCGQDAMAALVNLRLNGYLRDVAACG